MWTPDVYQGAPTPVTAFMSVGAKAGGFAALLALAPPFRPWPLVSAGGAVGCVLTMIWGNVAAIVQPNIKRLWPTQHRPRRIHLMALPAFG
jgi:NADH-quinone oxidoreductase subunit N